MPLLFTKCYTKFMQREQWAEQKFLHGLKNFMTEDTPDNERHVEWTQM